jgi:6-pyruvoyltetrahydropterin/6-carboxytetrahydropterin synthase
MELGRDGLLIDFKMLKEATKKTLDELDHKFLNELDAFRSLSPSSENIARHVFESISRQLNCQEVRVSKVTAWESDSACASYIEA